MKALNFLRPVSIKNKERMGNQQDGGYVIYKKTLASTDQLLTYGVGWDTSFEEHFKESTGKAVIMFDPTMYGKYFLSFRYLKELLIRFRLSQAFTYLLVVKKIWLQHRMFHKKELHFVNEGLSAIKREKYDTLESHMERFGLKNKQLLLKIDIEGGEYAIFNNPDILKHISNVNQILVEWHDLKNRLWDIKQAVSLLSDEFEIVHIHGNNYGTTFKMYNSLLDGTDNRLFPDVIETTFVRRTCIDKEDFLELQTSFPIEGLDFPNNPFRTDIKIEFDASID